MRHRRKPRRDSVGGLRWRRVAGLRALELSQTHCCADSRLPHPTGEAMSDADEAAAIGARYQGQGISVATAMRVAREGIMRGRALQRAEHQQLLEQLREPLAAAVLRIQ